MLKSLFFISGFGPLVVSCSQESTGYLVSNPQEFNQAVENAQPGSTKDQINTQQKLSVVKS